MTFWAYMLHCRGGSFYVGHTDDIERRIGDHKSGLIWGFTADHQPVEHVWSQEFATRDEAKAAEKQIKGWSRAKKLALIRGDWERNSMLAKGKNDRWASPASGSTSSGRTGLGEGKGNSTPKSVYPELVEGLSFSLQPHPETPPLEIEGVEVWFECRGAQFRICYLVFGALPKIPIQCKAERTDGLWQTTCFELFVRPEEGEVYFEFNFAPGGPWAAYRFEKYREGQTDLSVPAPTIEPIEHGIRASGELGIEVRSGIEFGLSAVIEETDGTKSYWALAHPPGKPDFHHPSCFTITLPAPQTT